MKKTYVITKSMSRAERAELCKRIYTELFESNNKGTFKDLTEMANIIKAKKKKDLFGVKSKEVICTVKKKLYKSLTIYYIMNKSEGYDIIFNTSPIDAGFVEFIRVIPNGSTVLYTQHLFDRYNERIHKKKYGNHKDMMKRFFANNPVKAGIIIDKDGSNNCSQRIDEGFVMGMFDEGNNRVIMNTFYDSEENRDSEIKSRTRKQYKKLSELAPKEITKYDNMQHEYASGLMSLEDYAYQMELNGFI